ncbi:MAG: rRNA maturation RNase YbeY [Flavobacteriaceae bacterium]|nr:rRNA maturation RNase YbeY [Flavobacteriaceae bacterium]
MINFFYEYKFLLESELDYKIWIEKLIDSEQKDLGELSFIFTSDKDLLRINQQYLNHDYYTDIITFDYVSGTCISGDIYISIDRVKENAKEFDVDFYQELQRVIAHGILHLCGYKDKSEEELMVMRAKENEKILMFHVEQ